MIRTVCPCGCHLKVSIALAGRLFKCPKCGQSVTIPNPAATQGPQRPNEPTNEVDTHGSVYRTQGGNKEVFTGGATAERTVTSLWKRLGTLLGLSRATNRRKKTQLRRDIFGNHYFPESASDPLTTGFTFLRTGDFDAAVAAFTEALRGNPESAEAYHNRGVAYAFKLEYDRAIADTTEALRLNPTIVEAYLSRGAAHRAKGNFDACIADCTSGLRLDPNYPEAHFERGYAYLGKEEFDKAIADFSDAISFCKNAEAYVGRGIAFHRKGEPDKAIADLTEAIRLNRSHALAYANRARSSTAWASSVRLLLILPKPFV